MLHSLSDQAKIRKQVLYTNKAAWILCLDVHWAGKLPAATSAVPTRPRQHTRPHFLQKALNWNNPVQAQDAISFSKVYCFRRYSTTLITKQNGKNIVMEWKNLALALLLIQLEQFRLNQLCFIKIRMHALNKHAGRRPNLSYSNSAVPHEYSGKSGILMSHVCMCLSRDGA